ncbi:ribonuclease H [Trifolium pratense]|uniref:Ribonuclease H n=1 Tax=Trifolium pratense TaxID=57577 RepID=A0A2K3PBR2_TRIPR|nr:ribonuclease H [Trifolium pratense]
MDSLISKNQSAFLKGRLLVDGVLAINEVVDWVKKKKKECLIFKVDFEKAYDSVSWSFLDYMLRGFGFGEKWRSWIRACVFAGSLSVLVNGSPTEQIDISKGLKQGDPLAPFLFNLVAEVLRALMKNTVNLGYFKGIQISNSGVIMSHLQYADDTLFVGEECECVENLWTIKAILRWFELISGLKVNFFKSKLFGINVGDGFINSATAFLKCKIGSLPFIYLGLPVGANPRRVSTWNPVIEVLQKRLASWKNKYVSLWGRVVLLNSVLAEIPIFYLSLFKMPVGVWKKIIRLQRRFLWGGAAGASKISWVNWLDVCRSKKEGGLGVKDLRIMNISLLAKWKWRLLSEDESIWKNVLRDKYGSGEVGTVWMSRTLPSAKVSPWWNDLMSIGMVVGVDHIHGMFFKKIGNGGTTSFWHDSWLGPQPLKEVFPRFFLISVHKESSVLEVGRWVSGCWEWEVRWRRNLFVWEEELQNALLEVLTPIQLSNVEDEWRCHYVNGGMFSVSLLYKYLSGRIIPPIARDPKLVRDLGFLWESLAPSKVIVFSWQLLLCRLPIRVNLAKREIVDHDSNSFCVLCPMHLESEGHLFGWCALASSLWSKVFGWFGWDVAVTRDPLEIFRRFCMGRGGGKRLKGLLAVWHVVVWAIWKVRNDLIFNSQVPVVDEVFDRIIATSWKWLVDKKKGGVCCLYEWKTYPMDCICR